MFQRAAFLQRHLALERIGKGLFGIADQIGLGNIRKMRRQGFYPVCLGNAASDPVRILVGL